MPGRVQKFFTLLGLLKYGIVLSLLLIYLPLTTAFKDFPGHYLTGNMFVELRWFAVLIAMMFLLPLAWSIMFTEGLIVNGSENRFDKTKAPYRSLRHIQATPAQHIPAWADFFFAVPVTGWQFVWFTILLAGPSFLVIVWRSADGVQELIPALAISLIAMVMSLLAFAIDYIVFIVLCTPAALLDTGDPPLRGFP